jgi:hypothetical protein
MHATSICVRENLHLHVLIFVCVFARYIAPMAAQGAAFFDTFTRAKKVLSNLMMIPFRLYLDR